MAEESGTPRRRWMTWALVGSVGLNLAFAGLILGAILKGPPPPPPPPGLWQYARALPDPYRRDLGRAIRDSRDAWIGPREALRGQRAEFAAALTAEPFDAAAVERVLGGAGQIIEDLSDRGTGLLMQQVTRMTPDERAAYARALLQDRRGPPDHDGPPEPGDRGRP